MKDMSFTLTGEYIELIKLLKFLGIAENGSQSKILVEEGNVKVNGTPEYRKRAKLRKGHVIEVKGCRIEIV